MWIIGSIQSHLICTKVSWADVNLASAQIGSGRAYQEFPAPLAIPAAAEQAAARPVCLCIVSAGRDRASSVAVRGLTRCNRGENARLAAQPPCPVSMAAAFVVTGCQQPLADICLDNLIDFRRA